MTAASVFQQTSYHYREVTHEVNQEASEYLAFSNKSGQAGHQTDTEDSRDKQVSIVIPNKRYIGTEERVRRKEKFIQAKFKSLTL